MFHFGSFVFYKSTKPQPVDTRHANQPVDVENIKNIPWFIGFQNIPKKWYETAFPSNHTEFPFFLGLSSEVFPRKEGQTLRASWGFCESPDHQHHKYEVPERKLLEHSKSKVMMLPSAHPPPDKKKISFSEGRWERNETYFFHFHQPDSKQIQQKSFDKWAREDVENDNLRSWDYLKYCKKTHTHTADLKEKNLWL